MRSVSKWVLELSISCVAGVLLMVFFPGEGRAQSSCAPTYSGCSPCDYSYLSEQWCWTNASEPRPYATILMWNPYSYEYVTATCRARNNLPPSAPSNNCEPAQPADPNVRNVYRFYLHNSNYSVSDHMSAKSYSGASAWGTYENRLFHILISPIDGNMVSLQGCYGSWGDHWLDTDPTCGGHTNFGSMGYISTIPRPGYIALYRFVRLNPWDFVETTDWNEVVTWNQHSYVVLGYVPE